MGRPFLLDNMELEGDIPAFPTIEGYLFGSFLPGITDLGQQSEFGGNFGGTLGPLDGWIP